MQHQTSSDTDRLLHLEVVKDKPNLTVVVQLVHLGADVLFKPTSAHNPALHCSVVKGHLAVLCALLETPLDLDFTIPINCGRTPLHCVCYYASREQMIAMTAAIVSRLSAHPKDVVNWGQLDKEGDDFLSLAARKGVLSVLYPLVKDQPYYKEAVKPLVLTRLPTKEDWDRVSSTDKKMLFVSNGLVSGGLHEELTKPCPQLNTVSYCVLSGADILYQPRPTLLPTLHNCARRGLVHVLEQLLTTERDVDFTTVAVDRNPVLWVCHGSNSPETMKELITFILHRLATHPNDRVDWAAADKDGLDFLSLAAKHGVLSDLYPLVKDQPYYVNAAKPLVLAYMPGTDDWAKLNTMDQKMICVTEVVCSETLYGELLKEQVDASMVSRCVSGGADVLYKPPGKDYDYSTLHTCIKRGFVEVLKELLLTPRDVDFTVTGCWCRTPLHCVCLRIPYMPPHTREQMIAMTAAIVSRLSAHPKDLVNWGQLDKEGDDFLSLAARKHVLSYLYPLVKDQPYYRKAAKPLVLTYSIRGDDYSRLNPADAAVFQVSESGYGRCSESPLLER